MATSRGKGTQSISGRVLAEDYDFLMGYPIAGQVTASEKLRYVLSFFRQHQQSVEDYAECLSAIRRQLEPALKRVKKAEEGEGAHSDLLDKLFVFLPQALAQLATAEVAEAEPERLKDLLQLEEKLFQQALGLLEAVLRMGLASRSPTYNPNLLQKRLKIVHELVDLNRKNPG